MEERDLNKIIETLDKNSSKDNGYFDLDYKSFNEEEEFSSCIRSNKDGLPLYAKELLISLRKINDSNDKIESIRINGEEWLGYDIKGSASLIRPIYKSRKEIDCSNPYKKSIKDKLTPYIFLLLVTLFIMGILGGIFQIISWTKS